MNSFSPEVVGVLQYYIYLLVDPRNSKCFYVGKGVGNRCFTHVNHPNGDSEKAARIREIQNQGLSVCIYIARFGIESEKVAYDIEATLIDIINVAQDITIDFNRKQLTNIQGGHHSSLSGLRSAEEINRIYSAVPVEVQHSVIAVKIDRAISDGKDVYQAARKSWKLSLSRANQTSYLLAVYRGIIEGVYEGSWTLSSENNGRIEFDGSSAPQDIQDYYIGKRLPDSCNIKGAQTPARYIDPDNH
ncbi:LEM-3-like GIY-YIG domain-containing protein [Porphyromonas gulae]|uniref:GIY-YIG domain-containing protein n=1 Tax=Porphyromonas gulae TaxID=111105 RepID=A0A0A2F998_9PORP|nr:hypothetical protein [Porphyromonas gulae]KGN87591.1 hypothetical protein HR15_06120 [Porphyromonas gulae]KKC51101.1 hypothetical protein HR10_06285 [Porphyromonas gulae]